MEGEAGAPADLVPSLEEEGRAFGLVLGGRQLLRGGLPIKESFRDLDARPAGFQGKEFPEASATGHVVPMQEAVEFGLVPLPGVAEVSEHRADVVGGVPLGVGHD